MILAQGSLVHAWVVLPIAAFALLVVSAHALAVARSDMPPSRRRIRLSSAMLMLLMIPVGAFALGIADPTRDQRAFVLAWMLVTGLVAMLLMLAGLDMANTWRLHRRDLREMRRELRDAIHAGRSVDAADAESPARTLPGG